MFGAMTGLSYNFNIGSSFSATSPNPETKGNTVTSFNDHKYLIIYYWHKKMNAPG